MKYFLDFGTHKFEGLDEFVEKLNIDKTFNVYCFEPNLEIYNKSRLLTDKLNEYSFKFNSFSHYNLAIYNYNGEIKFNSHKGAWNNLNKDEYISGYTTGSNCLDINPWYDAGNGFIFDIEASSCKCMDIIELMSRIVDNDNNAEIYIKCDIEGSEFVVLPKLLNTKYVHNIKNMYIEWHERFWYGSDEFNNKLVEKNNIIESLNKFGVNTFTHT